MKIKKPILTILVLAAIATGLYIIQITVGFPPSDATGSAIKGVQKANKYKIEDDTEVELVGENVQILLQNDEFQALMKDKNFTELIASESFAELTKNTDFLELTQNQDFSELMENGGLSDLSLIHI